mgnify:CR=1 FL=1
MPTLFNKIRNKKTKTVKDIANMKTESEYMSDKKDKNFNIHSLEKILKIDKIGELEDIRKYYKPKFANYIFLKFENE